MASIQLNSNPKNDMIVGEIGAILVDRPWPGGGAVTVVQLFIGGDQIQIWPISVEQLVTFGMRITRLAKKLQEKLNAESDKRESEQKDGTV